MIILSKKLSTYFLFLVNRFQFIGYNFLSTLRQRYCLLCSEPCENQPQNKSTSPSRIVRICQPCIEDLPWNDLACTICALPLSNIFINPNLLNSKHICGECFKHQAPFERVVSVFRYDFPIDSLIQKIKYQHQRYWLKSLSTLLAIKIKQTYLPNELPEILIPIPLHPRKKRIRSYNQAEIISQYLSHQLGINSHNKILIKTKLTESQTSLSKKDRAKNLKGSLMLNKKAEVRGKYIAIIDDVITTRATTELATKILIKAGATRVDIWSIARTAKHRG